jgi:peptidoglycan/LPS O-acetylase OafA/YrhL
MPASEMIIAEVPPKPKIKSNSAVNFRQRLPALDGLRGVAILAVFFYHYAGGAGLHANSAQFRVISALFALGWTGVDLFFVLSGFLITGVLYDTRDDPKYYRNFYARRVLRIFPIYYLVVAIYVCLGPFVGAHWKAGHLFFLVYLGYPAALVWPSLTTAAPFLPITHLWSLSVEEQFYSVWPWVIAKLRHPAAILRACALVAAFALVLRISIWASGLLNPGWATAFLLCRMDGLALGAAIAILVRGPQKTRVFKWAPTTFLLATGTMIGVFLARHTVNRNDPVVWTIGYSLIAIGCGSLMVLCLRPGSWGQRLFTVRMLRIFGKYSYGLYLYHFPLAVVLSPVREHFIALMHSFWMGGVPGSFCTSEDETNWNKRSSIWHEGRSIQQSRS